MSNYGCCISGNNILGDCFNSGLQDPHLNHTVDPVNATVSCQKSNVISKDAWNGHALFPFPPPEFQITGKPSKTNRSMMFDGTCGVKAIVFKCWCYRVISESKKWPYRRCLRAVCVSLFDKLDVRAVSAYILAQRRYDPIFKKKNWSRRHSAGVESTVRVKQ